MKNKILSLGLLGLLLSCNSPQTNDKNEMTETTDLAANPLLQESELPYGAPDFTKIRDEHYLPAMEEAMRLQLEKVRQIIENTEEPTFENTVLALEKSGKERSRAGSVFFAMTSAHTNDKIKEVQETLAPLLAQHSDEIYLNSDLFAKVQTVYESLDQTDLDSESKKLTEEYYKNFIQAGANLNDEDKEKLKSINSELAKLQTTFNQTLLNATNGTKIEITDKERLAGLSESDIKAIENEDGNGWTIGIQNTTQQPFLASLEDRDLREQLFKTSWDRTNGGQFNTNDIIVELAQLRAEKANLLGFDTYADWSLVNTMVKTTDTVEDFFAGIIPAVRKKAAEEASAIQQMMREDGIQDELKPWDWSYYSEKVRKAKYDLDESEITPYFLMDKVLEDGVFFAATELYGITFEKRDDIPTYHPDVVVYEIFEEDGTPLALFYGDFFARESKRGGAWMGSFVSQSKLYDEKPVIYNVCNYQKPAQGAPALITFDNVVTLFHEFGHTLHGLFADQMYPSLSGTSVARDFVELPSQANEHWVLDEKVLTNYAKHHETGEVIPQALITKIKNASTFNQGFAMTEIMAAADLDFRWHSISKEKADEIKDPNEFEKEVLIDDNLWDENIPPRYRSSYFAHIFGGGYAAGYYSYLWTEMLALDTGQWFEENGGLNRESGQRYRDMILSRGNTMDYQEMYHAFRGSDPKPDAIIQSKGLN